VDVKIEFKVIPQDMIFSAKLITLLELIGKSGKQKNTEENCYMFQFIKGSYRGFNFNLLNFFFEIQNKIMVFCCSKYTKSIGNLVKVPSKYIELDGYLIFKKGKLVCVTCLVKIKA
jgi:hypothetical protein